MACWALWQRLPPRYQLTTKEMMSDELDSCLTSPRTPQSPRTLDSPRVKTPNSRPDSSPRRSRVSSARVEPPGSASRGQATMYFTVTSPRDVEAETSCSPRPAFPVRKSSFVNSFKQQQRINSARQMFQDPSTATPKSYTPKMRARTAPSTPTSQFPVTHLASHHHNTEISKNTVENSSKNGTSTQAETNHVDSTSSPRRKRSPSKSAGTRSQPQAPLSVNTIVPFETTPKPFLKNPLYPDVNGRRYVVRGLNNATMFIDNDKVVVIKNNKPNQANFDESTSYIAHLRKLYLQEPRDIAKLSKPPTEKELNKSKLIRERLEYEKRTDHILNYYSRENDAREFSDGNSRGRPQPSSRQIHTSTTPRSARAFSSRDRRQTFSSSARSPTRSRPQSARVNTSPRRAPPYQHAWQHPEPQHYGSKRDALADWNVFLKINSRSTLHERQFYLQTPGSPHQEAKPASPDCSCQLCRLELEMALMQGREGHGAFLSPPHSTTQTQTPCTVERQGDDLPRSGKNDSSRIAPLPGQQHAHSDVTQPGIQRDENEPHSHILSLSSSQNPSRESSKLKETERSRALNTNPVDDPHNKQLTPGPARQSMSLVIPSEDMGITQEQMTHDSEKEESRSSERNIENGSPSQNDVEENPSAIPENEDECVSEVTAKVQGTPDCAERADMKTETSTESEGRVFFTVSESFRAGDERGQDLDNVQGIITSPTEGMLDDNNNNDTRASFEPISM